MLRHKHELAGGVVVALLILLAIGVQTERQWSRERSELRWQRQHAEKMRVAWQLSIDPATDPVEAEASQKTDDELTAVQNVATPDPAAPPPGLVAPPAAAAAVPEAPRVPIVTNAPTTTEPVPAAPPAAVAEADLREDVFALAAQFQVAIRELRLGAGQQGSPEISADAERALVEAGALARLATARSSFDALRAQFRVLDEIWQPLAARVRHTPGLTSWTAERLARGDRASAMLRGVLGTSPAPSYDRQRVADLTRQLSQSAARLVENLNAPIPGVSEEQELWRLARRVQIRADDLATVVSEGSGLVAAVEEYQDFAHAWHRFVQWSLEAVELDPQVRTVASQIWHIDRALHAELLVDPPAYPARRQAISVADRVVEMARRLPRVLQAETGGGFAEALTAAQGFAADVESFYLWYQQQEDVSVLDSPIAEMLVSWRALENQLSRIDRVRAPASYELANELEQSIESLHTRLAAKGVSGGDTISRGVSPGGTAR